MFSRLLVVSFVSGVAWFTSYSPPQSPFDLRANYTKTEHQVAMRDGVKLFTIVHAPKDQSRRHPFMLHRTPYGSPPYGADTFRASLGPSAFGPIVPTTFFRTAAPSRAFGSVSATAQLTLGVFAGVLP